MRILLALIILLCGSQVLAASNDVLLNLKDPSSSNPLTPTLKVEGKVDGATNPTVKVPMLPCVANAVAPTWAEGSIVPCSTDLAGTMRTSTSGGGSTYLDADAIANQTTTAVHGQTYMYNGATWDRVRGTIVGGLQVNCITGCAGGASTPTDAFANPVTAGLQQTFNMGFNGATWDRLRSTIAGGLLVNVSNASLAVTTVDTISTNNSTTATLGIGGVFTGASDDIQNFKAISVLIFSDKNSATLGISFQWSSDNVNWDVAEAYDYLTANGGASFIDSPRARFFRLVYTNGAVAQTVFRVQTILRVANVTDIHDRVKNVPLANDSTTNVHAVIAGETTAGGGAFVNVKVNPSGALTADVTQATSPWVVSGTVAVSNALLLDATFTGRFPVAYVDADTIANQTTTAVHGQNYIFNPGTVAWDRMRSPSGDALAIGGMVSSGNLVFNSATWDRVREPTADGLTAIGLQAAGLSFFNGASWDRVRGTVAGGISVGGTKTDNGGVPGATNIGVLPCVANAAAPVRTEGNQVGCSTNLSGATRTINESSIATANNDGACSSGAVSFTAIASNASRTWLAVWASPANTDDVYLKLGAVATNADARFAPGQPLNFTSGRIYTGIIDAFPASGTQAVCVMELN